MEIIHVSAECYPVAKAGGLGDVVGALPKYQRQLGHVAKVVMPMYRTKFLLANEWDVVHKGYTHLGNWWFNYTVIKEKTNKLGFDLYLVDINGVLDREKVYGYDDDIERFVAFQVSVADWLVAWKHRPDIVHVHDHQAALIPFFFKYCHAYQSLADIPTVLTIHNAQYQGWMGWDKSTYIPAYDTWKTGMLGWGNAINSLGSGIKCAWKVTTVSPTYLEEMRSNANGLEALLEYEKGKCSGILNGIDNLVWDPSTDGYFEDHFTIETVEEGKRKNKELLCQRFQLDPKKPLITFIGRLVGEKGADLLPQAIEDSFYYVGRRMNFLILGSGFPDVEGRLNAMKGLSRGDYNVYIGYDEALSHLMYAGADYILMPSRVEPCGLNQLYALRYGTIPVVRNTGGLHDTVLDYGDKNGYGIRFNHASVGDMTHGIWRAVEMYQQSEKVKEIRQHIMQLDFSWESSVKSYMQLYESIK
ncbi:MAG: glycogen synthase [Sphingobacteriales bacterium 50-39]|nr:glycogen/starch synthase [Sphingobacteriales bacterium]OJW60178.1 MAG: glycogen synthase [Sphingobacteriales bacterium 50-39]